MEIEETKKWDEKGMEKERWKNARKLRDAFSRSDLHHYVFGRQWRILTPPRHASKEALALFILRHFEDPTPSFEECFVCYGEHQSATFQCHTCAFVMCVRCESSLRLQNRCPQCERLVRNHEVDEFVRSISLQMKSSFLARLFSFFFVARDGKKKNERKVKKKLRSKILVQW